ncbi:MAG: hypothetical protein BWY21_00130 [Parcubacteria group bacterium ADurb.Bin216]|nr:MAG: hypothetical protein BWY21_00130 [Parcubacteria group bacterium ADurb.Bin216]
MTFLLLYWKHLLVVAALTAGGWLGYHKIYNIGYDAASQKYEKQIAEYNTKLNKRIDILESSSTVLIEQLLVGNQGTKNDLANILKTIKGKPLYIIDPKGQCKLSDDFIKAYNDGIGRVNK